MNANIGHTPYRHIALTAALFVWLIALLVSHGQRWLRPASMDQRDGAQVSKWETLVLGRSPVLGVPSAKFKIIEFSDYQCPFCSIVDPVLAKLVAGHPNDTVVYRYDMPLQQIHRYAYAASIAANCAEQQGVRESYQSLLYQYQREFASINWTALAKQSGVVDTDTFAKCVKEEKPREQVLKDIKTANSLGISGTPSFIINGTLYTEGMTEEKLESLYKETTAKQYGILRRLFNYMNINLAQANNRR